MVNYMEELSVTEADNLKKDNCCIIQTDMYFTDEI